MVEYRYHFGYDVHITDRAIFDLTASIHFW